MTWVLLLIAAWLAVSLPLALIVCRSIRTADQEAGRTSGRRPHHTDRLLDGLHTSAPRGPVRRRSHRRRVSRS